MRADHAVRHNAATGALIGLAVGDILGQLDHLPPTICPDVVELPAWGVAAEQSFVAAEALLSHQLLDMSLSATDIVGPAIALANPTTAPPLLTDPEAVLLCSTIRAGLLGRFDVEQGAPSSDVTASAIDATLRATTFAQALTRAPAAAMPLTGALAGLRWGSAAIPASWATSIRGPVANRSYGLRQLRRLAERLLSQDAPAPPEPRRSLGPREVAPKLWLSNLHAVPKFVSDQPDGAVISLCPTTGAFDSHPLRREFALHDAAGSKVNPGLGASVDEILATIAAFHATGRHVLVHCHHGASRTGLVLRAWLVQELGLDAEDATTEAQVRWSKTSTWNNAFSAEIRRRADGRSPP